MFAASKLVGCICASVVLATTSHAQDLERGALQAVGLFQQACVRFTENPVELRSWIAAYRLPRVPAGQAEIFAAGRPAQVFGASTDDGKLAIISYDDGSCKVMAMSASGVSAERELISVMRRLGSTVTLVADRRRPDGSATQRVYRVSSGVRRWMLSVTIHVHHEAPDMLPQLSLLATGDPGEAVSRR